MANHYTRNADKKRLAVSGAEKLNVNILIPHSDLGEGLSRISDLETDT